MRCFTLFCTGPPFMATVQYEHVAGGDCSGGDRLGVVINAVDRGVAKQCLQIAAEAVATVVDRSLLAKCDRLSLDTGPLTGHPIGPVGRMATGEVESQVLQCPFGRLVRLATGEVESQVLRLG